MRIRLKGRESYYCSQCSCESIGVASPDAVVEEACKSCGGWGML